MDLVNDSLCLATKCATCNQRNRYTAVKHPNSSTTFKQTQKSYRQLKYPTKLPSATFSAALTADTAIGDMSFGSTMISAAGSAKPRPALGVVRSSAAFITL